MDRLIDSRHKDRDVVALSGFLLQKHTPPPLSVGSNVTFLLEPQPRVANYAQHTHGLEKDIGYEAEMGN